jgi:hypothetical protein
MSLNDFSIALATIFAEDSLDLVVVHNVHPVDIILVEVKGMASIH